MMSFVYSSRLRYWRFRGVLLTSGALYFGTGQGRTASSKQESHTHLSSQQLVTSPITSPITLYQYHSCPFCAKTRAFFDYYGIKYTKVEVNPLFKREMKFSSYRKVPFIVVGSSDDALQINDSSLLISVLRSSMLLTNSKLSEVLDMYPVMDYINEEGKSIQDRANKYFIMYGESATDGKTVDERRDERWWREWVDTSMVHTLSPNIYRSPREALQAFDYMSTAGNFSTVERVMAKYIGALVMFGISKRLKKKYGLKDDVRQSLYDCCKKWLEAIGEDRQFMGGDCPNMADLAVYGILSAIEGLDTFNDVISNTKMKGWYYAVKDRVIKQEGLQ